jgi:hypothetical protein
MHPRRSALAPLLMALAVVLGLWAAPPAGAAETHVTVRVLARDAKFVGTSMGGVRVTLRDMDTGKILAQGRIAGGTGDTDRIMRRPRARGAGIATADAAAYTATLDLDRPTRVEVIAEGPLGHPRSIGRVSATQWVVPGHDLTGGDGWVLELPGFVVDLSAPTPDLALQGVPQTVALKAKVTPMCGCPVEPKGLWNADGYQVRALIRRDGQPQGEVPLAYAGQTSLFAGNLQVTRPGTYEAVVYAYDPKTGNTGLDRTVFTVSP